MILSYRRFQQVRGTGRQGIAVPCSVSGIFRYATETQISTIVVELVVCTVVRIDSLLLSGASGFWR